MQWLPLCVCYDLYGSLVYKGEISQIRLGKCYLSVGIFVFSQTVLSKPVLHHPNVSNPSPSTRKLIEPTIDAEMW
jgi:hypothetical protein